MSQKTTVPAKMPRKTAKHCRSCKLPSPGRRFPAQTQCTAGPPGKSLDDRSQFRGCRDIIPTGPVNVQDRRLERRLPKIFNFVEI